MEMGFSALKGAQPRDAATGRFLSVRAAPVDRSPVELSEAGGAPFAERMKSALGDVLGGHAVNGPASFARAATLFGADVALVLEKRTGGEIRALAVAFRLIVDDIAEMRESDRLIAIAMRAFGVTRNEILSFRRSRRIVMARHFVMFWLFRRTPMSSTQIGRRIGGRDHTTALHARDTWPKKRGEARLIRRAIRNGQPITDQECQAMTGRTRWLAAYAGREERA